MPYQILVHAHSGLRWIVIFLLVWNMMNALLAMSTKRSFSLQDKRLSAIGLGSFHLQVVIGLILYMLSPKVQISANTMSNAQLRFFTVEHLLGMLIAVALVTIAHRKAKAASFKGVFWYYLIAFAVIMISIPWPFRGFGNGWY